ncbi:MAG TPA: hypothetical protein VFR90_16690 [Methylibium sp.]|uniref:preprotein translocase subunit SecA n=1 Tax=Methylibium sp. TaxID=2067992 RepID=UPI002DBD0CC5|nr:hypothetical protein [Methylibium sp.]HEU4460759.1 hypothetical protein [Methylibium sp.]
MPALPAALPRPGPLHGPYPQRRAEGETLAWRLIDAAGDALAGLPGAAARAEARFLRRIEALPAPPDAAAFAQELAGVRAGLSRHGFDEAGLARGLRLAAEALRRSRGQTPYPTQLRAARAMLQGRLVELDTGEGKSIALLLAAAVAALAGVPVHVVSSNDYLCARDAEAAAAPLALLGLRAGAIQAELAPEARRARYACDVCWVTARELGFDYMKDGLGASPPLLRGLNLALIDEADSVLIDHARTPLLIARAAPPALAPARLAWAQACAASLREGEDFRLDAGHRAVELSDAGRARIDAADAAAARADAAAPRDPRAGRDLVRQALVARHLLRRDRDYLIVRRDGRDLLQLIDPTTGRAMPGTQWQRALHALVAHREGLELPPAMQVEAQLAVQSLFARYLQLGGASGTLREARLELRWFYRLPVRRIEPHRPGRRRELGTALFADAAARCAVVAARARAVAAAGRAMLIGCGSVAEAEALAAELCRRLADDGAARVQLLHARHAADEPERLAQAGRAGTITVTTLVAGRGADIACEPAVLAAGGLHVANLMHNRSARLDRQLLGRAARHGAPGSCETLRSLDDEALAESTPRALRALARACALPGGWRPAAHDSPLPPVRRRAATAFAAVVQAAQGAADLHARWQLRRDDRRRRIALAFSRGPV